MTRTVTRIIGVYHADGGILGELRYVAGKLLGTAHCALCDITHAGVRHRPDWDTMVTDLGVDVSLLHLNELDTDQATAVRRSGSPVVLAGLDDGALVEVLTPSELDELGGSVEQFDLALQDSMARHGLTLSKSREPDSPRTEGAG